MAMHAHRQVIDPVKAKREEDHYDRARHPISQQALASVINTVVGDKICGSSDIINHAS